MTDDRDLYLEPKRHLSWHWWLVLGVAGVLLAATGLALALGIGSWLPGPAAETPPSATLVPTFTPRPQATTAPPVVTLSAQPWHGDIAPGFMIAVILSLPSGAQVSHQPPAGFRYWCGDLVETRDGLAWSGNSGGEVHWYLFAEPDATFPARLMVTVNGRDLALDLQPAAPTTASLVLEE